MILHKHRNVNVEKFNLNQNVYKFQLITRLVNFVVWLLHCLPRSIDQKKNKIPNSIYSLFYRCNIDLSQLEKEKTHDLWQELEYGYGCLHLLITLNATGLNYVVDSVPTTNGVQHAALPKDFVSTNLFNFLFCLYFKCKPLRIIKLLNTSHL